MKTFWAFLLLIGFLFVACLFTGCAQMGTRQLDRNTTTRYELDKAGKTNAVSTEIRETSTKASGRALGAGQTALKGFSAKQDGGLQGLDIQESSQKTDAIRDAVEALKLMRDLGGMVYGIPPAQPAAPPSSPPAGKKWVLVPKDEPSKPQPEQE